MKDNEFYTRKDWHWAVNLSALVGWAVVSAPFVLGSGFAIIPWAAGFGLPIAFLICWLIVAPALERVMRKPVTWLRAIGWGIVVSALIALVSVAIGRLLGLIQFMNPNSYSQLGGGDAIQSVDGILTAYGWWVLGQRTMIFIVFGVFIALIIRLIIGPGRKA